MAVDQIEIEMPLPAKALHPNSRPHWATKASAVKAQRSIAAVMTMAAMRMNEINRPWPAAIVQGTFRYAMNRRRDGDGCNSSLKSALDGIADAGIVANDDAITLLPPKIVVDKDCKPGVTLTIRLERPSPQIGAANG